VDLREIIYHHVGNTGVEVDPLEADEPDPPPSIADVMKALSIVQNWAEHQDDATMNETALLGQFERSMHLKAARRRKQTALNGRDLTSRDALDRDALDRDALDRDALDRDALDRDALDRD
jgi:hypothetical protein